MYITKLKKLGTCGEALEWCEAGNYPTLDEAWQACERGDWMLWLAGKQAGEAGSEKRKRLVLAACECARLSLSYVSASEERPLTAIETAERWANGDGTITLATVRHASHAAHAANDAPHAAHAAADTAYAGTAHVSTDAANAAAYTAAYAGYAAYAAAYSGDAASYSGYDAAYGAAAARTNILKQCADIVRKYYPVAPVLEDK